jgi:rare lipoprotein A
MRDNKISALSLGFTSTVLVVVLSACTGIPERQVVQDKVDISTIADAVPQMEPLSESGNPESYVQGGKRYWIIPNPYNYKETGIASWYGPKFNGRQTSSGETYDMYKMTAAHKTLPLPTFVQVTNLANKNSVIVRVNDRGPFKDDRIIDLSYVAAKKLNITGNGTAQIEVRVIDPMKFTASGAGAEATPLSQAGPLPTEAIPAQESQANAQQANAESPPPTNNEGAAATAASVGSNDASGAPEEQIYVQVGAFGNAENAARLRAELSEIQTQTVIVDSTGGPQGIIHRVQIGPFRSEEEARKQEAPLKNHGIEKFQIIRK